MNVLLYSTANDSKFTEILPGSDMHQLCDLCSGNNNVHGPESAVIMNRE